MKKKSIFGIFKHILILLGGILCFISAFFCHDAGFLNQQKADSKAVCAEGSLWYDNKNSMYLVTLGESDGIKNGTFLSIVDGGKTIGRIKTKKVFSKTSIVDLLDSENIRLDKKYYKVITQ